jgi:hypothetical protein
VASAYGWVTIEIFSMVKRAHPLYSNNTFMRYNMTQILYLLHPKETFGWFGI